MSDNLFDEPQSASPETPTDDGDKDYASELVGEGKRFKDLNSLAKGKLEADAFIERLKREAEEARQELRKRMDLEQIVNKIAESQATPTRTNPSTAETPSSRETVGGHEDTTTLSPKVVSELVAKEISKAEEARTRSQNINASKAKLKEQWGDRYVEKLQSRARELGVTEEYLNGLAATQPSVLFAVLGVDKSAPPSTPNNLIPPRSTQATTASTPTTTNGVRNKAYYDKIKKDNPSLYFTKEVQVAEMNDALKLGSKFFE